MPMLNAHKRRNKKKTHILRTKNLWELSSCFFVACCYCCCCCRHYYYFSRNVRNVRWPTWISPFHQIETILSHWISPINWIRWNRSLKASINYTESIQIKLQYRLQQQTVVPILDSLSVIYIYLFGSLFFFQPKISSEREIREISYDSIIYCESIAFEIAIVGIKSLKFICRYLFNWMQLLEMPMPGYLYAITNEQTMHCSIRWALTGLQHFLLF